MMFEVTTKMGLSHESSTPYYPQANGKTKEINKVLKIASMYERGP